MPGPVLGVETSCDDTGLGLVMAGRLLCHKVRGQPAHEATLGVVPQVAAACHLEALDSLLAELLEEAKVALGDLAGVGVTTGPGLIGCLAVGSSWALGLATGLGVPTVGVNHLEAHVNALRVCSPPPEFPLLVLLASGGHTALIAWDGEGPPRTLCTTRDDAAGEALDKVARVLGLGFPGGAKLERLAAAGDDMAVPFPLPMRGRSGFSFSGLKTAGRRAAATAAPADLAASFQRAVCRHLLAQTEREAAARRWAGLGVVGGVAANGVLRRGLMALGKRHGLPVHLPPADLATDNGGMVALAAERALAAGRLVPVDELRPRWPLEMA
ncbi:tRNA (adenosine(37)-N6)-threonylcarbamoyltransferase complex transferase subunit TsaD [bacterium]|nr:tRNA (adenosine(37)-N6)-threonylcarbamoyltransferase complex transferase subunit TsaD [bacterium]